MPPKEVPQKKGKKNVKKQVVVKAPVKIEKVPNPLFVSTPINQRIGGDLRVRHLIPPIPYPCPLFYFPCN